MGRRLRFSKMEWDQGTGKRFYFLWLNHWQSCYLFVTVPIKGTGSAIQNFFWPNCQKLFILTSAADLIFFFHQMAVLLLSPEDGGLALGLLTTPPLTLVQAKISNRVIGIASVLELRQLLEPDATLNRINKRWNFAFHLNFIINHNVSNSSKIWAHLELLQTLRSRRKAPVTGRRSCTLDSFSQTPLRT